MTAVASLIFKGYAKKEAAVSLQLIARMAARHIAECIRVQVRTIFGQHVPAAAEGNQPRAACLNVGQTDCLCFREFSPSVVDQHFRDACRLDHFDRAVIVNFEQLLIYLERTN